MCLRLLFALSVVLLMAGCARKDTAVEGLVGTDPQRLSFGTPAEVRTSFIQKVKQCWLAGPQAPLQGYRFEASEKEADDGSGFSSAADGYQNLKFFNQSSGTPAFEVQFHKYNENTLIVTRNISLSNELMTQLKHDIQLWTLNSPQCGNI